jgi:SAM-dependent methyltransferase
MRMFLRKPVRERDPLPVTMAGVRMGERALQIGIRDPALTGVLAAKPGLSGNAAIALSDDEHAARAKDACAEAGVLADILTGPLDALALDDGSIDVAIVHASDPAIADLSDAARDAVFRECHRVLRVGGRLIVMTAHPEGGLASLFRRRPPTNEVASERILSSIEHGGFRAARLLAEREGARFFEGLKG